MNSDVLCVVSLNPQNILSFLFTDDSHEFLRFITDTLCDDFNDTEDCMMYKNLLPDTALEEDELDKMSPQEKAEYSLKRYVITHIEYDLVVCEPFYVHSRIIHLCHFKFTVT